MSNLLKQNKSNDPLIYDVFILKKKIIVQAEIQGIQTALKDSVIEY